MDYSVDKSLGFDEALRELRYAAMALSACRPVSSDKYDDYRCTFCYQKINEDNDELLHDSTCEWYKAINLFNRMGLTYKTVQKMNKPHE